MNVTLSQSLLFGYALAMTRTAAWLFTAPPFAGRLIPIPVKLALSAALALVVGPRLEAEMPTETLDFAGAIATQLLAGLALGFLVSLIFSAVQAAGGLVDLFSGYTMAQVLDPMSNAGASVFGRFYHLVAVTLLFALDGHLLVVRGFLTSFEAAPLTSISVDALRRILTEGMAKFLVAAVEIAAPILVALFLAEVGLGLLSRAAPQLNVMMIGFSLKVLLTLFTAALAIPLLPNAVGSLTRLATRGGAALFP